MPWPVRGGIHDRAGLRTSAQNAFAAELALFIRHLWDRAQHGKVEPLFGVFVSTGKLVKAQPGNFDIVTDDQGLRLLSHLSFQWRSKLLRLRVPGAWLPLAHHFFS